MHNRSHSIALAAAALSVACIMPGRGVNAEQFEPIFPEFEREGGYAPSWPKGKNKQQRRPKKRNMLTVSRRTRRKHRRARKG